MKVNQSADSVVFFRLVAANISVFLHSSNKGTASGINFIIHLFPENCLYAGTRLVVFVFPPHLSSGKCI